MTEPEVTKELSDHRTAFRAIVTQLERVPAIGIGSAAPLAWATNALRVASARDPRRLTEREKQGLIDALGAAHAALMKLSTEPAQASTITVGLNTMATLTLAWAGDPRWTRGSGPFAAAQKFALAWQLELIATAILDEVAADHQALTQSRHTVIERLMSAGILES